MAAHADVVIVGAGHAGAQAAISLRQQDFAGSITLIGDEPDLPYERPALSKDYLAGTKPFDRMLLRPLEYWQEMAVGVTLGHRVTKIDAAAHLVTLADDSTLQYGSLIWAAGGDARSLPCSGGDLAGIHGIRNRADVDRLLIELPDCNHVVIIGGGYIGLEAAAVLSKFGKKIVLLEALDRVLERVAGVELSTFYEAEHRSHGVDLRMEQRVDSFVGRNGRVAAVKLADGAELAADMVIVGIGIIPAVAPLLSAGAAGHNGVDVDEHCRTSLADIYAVGDCAAHVNRFADGTRIRLESIQNANDQATTAARFIAGKPVPYSATPRFWSNQYDIRLLTVGLSLGHDATVLRGDPATRNFSVIYLRGGRVTALDCVNASRDFIQGRYLVEAGTVADPERLADVSVSLKELAGA